MAAMGITVWLFWNSILLVITVAAVRAKRFPTVVLLTTIGLLLMWQHVAYTDVYYYGYRYGLPVQGNPFVLNATISYTDAQGHNITEYDWKTGKPGVKYISNRILATADEIVYVYVAWTGVFLINLASRLDKRRKKKGGG